MLVKASIPEAWTAGYTCHLRQLASKFRGVQNTHQQSIAARAFKAGVMMWSN